METDILWNTGTVINALPFPQGLIGSGTGFMHERRQGGRDL